MTFGESVKTVLVEKYADFSGRARRSEYWWFALFTFIVGLVLSIIMFSGMSGFEYSATSFDFGETTGMFVIGVVLLVVFYLAVLIPSIAVAVRRLHDQDKSGAYYFVNFIPYVGSLIFLILMVIEGTPGPNQYGPDPKAA
jgi:uncharacterized membrane protein YhaH (DUF805 family)